MEGLEIRSSDICLYLSVVRSHGNEGCAHVALVVPDGIIRSHHSVHLTLVILPCEYPHLRLFGESPVYIGVGIAGSLHVTVAVAVAARTFHYAFYPLILDLIIKRRPLLPPCLAVKALLHVSAYVLDHRILSITLHLGIDGGVDSQAVPVDVIFCSVRLGVLVEPAVEFVIGP